MKKSLLTATLLAAGLINQPVMAAADVEINWQEPDSYQDIRPSNQSRASFRKMVFSDLEQYMSKLAEDLPDGQTLFMTVTDLDLAGEVWPSSLLGGMGGSDIRLVKPVYIPRMSFSYTLKDAGGSVLQNADVKLKDMAFMDRGTRASRRAENLTYEKAMLRDWFEKTLEQTASHTP